MTELTKEEKREQWERKIFAAFAKCSGLNISESSIKSCKPPKPDICCHLDGSEYFFELGEVVPEVQAQALETKGIYNTSFPDPNHRGHRATVRILRKKQKKKYETGDSHVDLLLYFEKDFPLYLPDVKGDEAGSTDIDLAVAECKRLGRFSRIWSYCSWTDKAKRLA